MKPVIFYIHGGAGKFGCSHTDGLSGQQLVKSQDVVYVSANYRLGVFGFLAHPELRAEEEGAEGQSRQLASGSYGVLDLIAALTWVQENIKKFGGDPTRVTIWGLSTGSQLVHCLLVCPQARGLFHFAMMQSCVDFGNVRKLSGAGADIWQGKSAEQWGELAGEEWGCPRGKGQLAKMREVSAAKLAECSFSTATNDVYLPATDRRQCSSRPYSTAEAFFYEGVASGEDIKDIVNRVPLMIGSTEQDGLGKMDLEHILFEDITEETALAKLLKREFPNDDTLTETFLTEFYPHDDELREKTVQRLKRLQGVGGKLLKDVEEKQHVEQVLADWSKDIWYEAGTWIMADAMASLDYEGGAVPVYLYQFTEKVKWYEIEVEARSSHASDQRLWNGMKPIYFKEGVKDQLLTSAARGGDAHARSARLLLGRESEGVVAYEPDTSAKYRILTHTDPGDTVLGKTMMKMLGNFAHTGDPNSGPNSAEEFTKMWTWKKHSPGAAEYMELGPKLGMQRITERARRRYDWFLKQYIKRRVLAEMKT